MAYFSSSFIYLSQNEKEDILVNDFFKYSYNSGMHRNHVKKKSVADTGVFIQKSSCLCLQGS